MQNGLVVQEASPERLLGGPDNDFVRDFVGSDRALKRLGRFLVADHMEAVDAGETMDDSTSESVLPDATLREALSRILAVPDERISVVDSARHTVGTISLQAIQQAACRRDAS
jgi:osmoprotectant transport system ATP-binding protein